MMILKKILLTVMYILSAFVAAVAFIVILVYGNYNYSLYFKVKPTKQQLELSEAVFRSRDIVISYWNRHQNCPTSADLLSVQKISVVENIIIEPKLDDSQCIMILDLVKQGFDNKQIKQIFEFRETDGISGVYSCYHNMSEEFLPSRCQNLRDIDSFNKFE